METSFENILARAMDGCGLACEAITTVMKALQTDLDSKLFMSKNGNSITIVHVPAKAK